LAIKPPWITDRQQEVRGMHHNTKNILDLAHSLNIFATTVVEFSDAETLKRAASRTAAYSRYAAEYRHRRYATSKIIGVGFGGSIHYILRIERIN
jgi:hypothetical protein